MRNDSSTPCTQFTQGDQLWIADAIAELDRCYVGYDSESYAWNKPGIVLILSLVRCYLSLKRESSGADLSSDLSGAGQTFLDGVWQLSLFEECLLVKKMRRVLDGILLWNEYTRDRIKQICDQRVSESVSDSSDASVSESLSCESLSCESLSCESLFWHDIVQLIKTYFDELERFSEWSVGEWSISLSWQWIADCIELVEACYAHAEPYVWTVETAAQLMAFADFYVEFKQGLLSVPEDSAGRGDNDADNGEDDWNSAALEGLFLVKKTLYSLEHLLADQSLAAVVGVGWDELAMEIEMAVDDLRGFNALEHVAAVDTFLERLAVVQQLGASPQRVSQWVTRIMYNAGSEASGTAYFYLVPKSAVVDAFQAFAMLCIYQRDVDALWDGYAWSVRNQRDSARDEWIVNLWMYPAVVQCEGTRLTAGRLWQEMERVRGIMDHLAGQNYPCSEAVPQALEAVWGVFVNGERLTRDYGFEPLGLLPMGADSMRNDLIDTDLIETDSMKAKQLGLGLGLSLAWNDIKIFYETPQHYIFYCWGTGA